MKGKKHLCKCSVGKALRCRICPGAARLEFSGGFAPPQRFIQLAGDISPISGWRVVEELYGNHLLVGFLVVTADLSMARLAHDDNMGFIRAEVIYSVHNVTRNPAQRGRR